MLTSFLSSFYTILLNIGFDRLAFIILTVAIVLYAALLLIQKLRTTFPLNYILLIMVVISLLMGVGLLYKDLQSLVATLFAIAGFLLLILKKKDLPFHILAGILICSAAVLILFSMACGLRKRIRKLPSTFLKLMEMLNVLVAVIGMFVAVSVCFV
ncbi:unnamed protein product [Trichobilharzia szidati]|nr:unnamed protein product [Trichobilharzia szidati]